MQLPSRVWKADYRHDRRKHRHRCFCCSRILTEGEPAILGRVARGSRALHVECASKLASLPGDRDHPTTYGELLRAHASGPLYDTEI
jgi:hypothetical protein